MMMTSLGIKYLRCLCALLCALISQLLFTPLYAANTAPFIIELKTKQKTIGDIKPAFIVYKDKKFPKVSVNYVLKRYIKLFESANSPSVKIDALNRINNLRAKYQLHGKKLTIDKVKQSEVVLNSYDRIIDSGVFYQRMDELLYQTAKATKFVGNHEESIKRLKLLVGLYPRSSLVDESMFRIAESYFELGRYVEAEAQYKKILAFSSKDTFHKKTKFKLGWAAFRLERYQESSKLAVEVLDDYPSLRSMTNYDQLKEYDQDFVADTLRLLAILFSKQKDAVTIEQLQQRIGHREYAYLLYDSLFNFYLRQDRFQDGAVVSQAYTDNYPADFNAYKMANNTILSYRKGEFDIKEWAAKEHFVKKFGIGSEYWQSLNKTQVAIVKPLIVHNLNELAHLYFIRMQDGLKNRKVAKQINSATGHLSYQENGRKAADYYLELVKTRIKHNENGNSLYLAAEALYKIGDITQAIALYERSAYEQGLYRQVASANSKPENKQTESEKTVLAANDNNALINALINAGYAAILAYDKLAKMNLSSQLTPPQKEARIASIERFSKHFPHASQTPALINNLANDFFAQKKFLLASEASNRVIEMRNVERNILYSSWLVSAHSNFELKKYQQAEVGYQTSLSFEVAKDASSLRERLAASIYKQAESESSLALSAELFLKVVDVVPDASIVPQALYDASNQFLQTDNWMQAIATLNSFQGQFPKHALYNDASDKLIFAYLKNEEPISAAEKLVQVSNEIQDKKKASNALYRAAEIYQKNDFEFEAAQLFEAFTKQYPHQFLLNIEAQNYNVVYYETASDSQKTLAWRKKLIAYERKYSTKGNARSSYLAANAALSIAMTDLKRFNALKLTLPLKKSLDIKRKSLKKAVGLFEALIDYNVAEVASAATFQIGQIYRGLAQDLLNSERPVTLTPLQLEQYDILLEEQAYPFEEQAFDIFRINTAKVPAGEFDKWIEKTYQVLGEMNPTEFKRQGKAIAYDEQLY